jgi:hypothetical protein
MANPKKLKTWTRVSMAAHTSEDALKRQSRDYLAWLATSRGWLAEIECCPDCAGVGTLVSRSYYRRRRPAVSRYTCNKCHGTGSVPTKNGVPDIGRAEEYVSKQRHALEQIAVRAIDVARWYLLTKGAEPIKRRVWWHGVTGEHDSLLRFRGKVIFLGTGPRGGGFGTKQNPHDLAFIIRPGLAPTESEVCRMVDEFVAGIADDSGAEYELPLAA